MVFLCSLELGGRYYSPFPQGKVAQFRWGSHLPILTVLALVFVIPHDPSTRLDWWRVGSDAYQARARPARTVKAQRTQLAPARTPLPGASMQAGAVLLRESLESAASNALSLDQMVPAGLEEDVLRLWRCATSRPLMTSRLVLANTLHAVAAAAPPSPFGFGPSVASVADGEATLSLLADRSNATATAHWATSVEELREAYGTREHWYGDLNAQEARALYHALLPTDLATDPTLPYSLAERAKLAIAARKAARLYTRERALLPLTLGSQLLDAVRQVHERGAFQPHGLTEEQIWQKYLPPHVDCPSELSDFEAEAVYWRVLEKACTTNRHVDRLCAHGGVGAAAA